jgi:hypothetical protein
MFSAGLVLNKWRPANKKAPPKAGLGVWNGFWESVLVSTPEVTFLTPHTNEL